MNTTKFMCKYFSFDYERVSAASMLFFGIIYAAIIAFILSGFYGIFSGLTVPDYFARCSGIYGAWIQYSTLVVCVLLVLLATILIVCIPIGIILLICVKLISFLMDYKPSSSGK